jgi:nitroreductase
MPEAMTVSEAVARRVSIRGFLDTPVSAETVRDILVRAAQAPSGGNLQPWRVYAMTGRPLEDLKARVRANPAGETPQYHVYPPDLWDPFRTRRYQNGEDLYAAIAIPREDRPARLRQLAKNGEFFGAPVGLFFALDRKLGPPQWADVGMYMQNVMLLALERGLDTCPQEYWARYPETVAAAVNLPADHILFSGMALGVRDPDAPINTLRASRDPFEVWGEMIGFE